VSSTRAAEMTRILENTFRGVNIALASELKLLCLRRGAVKREN
jgi:UDP-N-acetyl-D-glucosamine dehydrogenase